MRAAKMRRVVGPGAESSESPAGPGPEDSTDGVGTELETRTLRFKFARSDRARRLGKLCIRRRVQDKPVGGRAFEIPNREGTDVVFISNLGCSIIQAECVPTVRGRAC